MIYHGGLIIRSKHQVTEWAGHRDVEPNWEYPSGKSSMFLKLIGKTVDPGLQNKGQADGRQHNVTDKHHKVDDSHGSRSAIFRFGRREVIRDITQKEHCGEDHRRGNKALVVNDVPTLDHHECHH